MLLCAMAAEAEQSQSTTSSSICQTMSGRAPLAVQEEGNKSFVATPLGSPEGLLPTWRRCEWPDAAPRKEREALGGNRETGGSGLCLNSNHPAAIVVPTTLQQFSPARNCLLLNH